MEHVAIMRPDWGFIEKILTGQKSIESRWYKRKYPPWERIQAGERVYFKNAGAPVIAQAEVEKVLYFSDLTPQSVQKILSTYGEEDGITAEHLPAFYERFKDKNYCMLIYLKNARRIPPFEIDKRGFGSQAAWLCVESTANITKSKQLLDSHT
jgi:ASC-1-like (ASCH) protein